MIDLHKIGLGGGCHWCTEAVFQSLLGVEKVEQGFVASIGEDEAFSEAVIVHFNTEMISLQTLIQIHLHTHKATSEHSMRAKYRSAIYSFSEEQKIKAIDIVNNFQNEFDHQIITKILNFNSFKPSRTQLNNYYFENPKKPFCTTYIDPKLKFLMDKFSMKLDFSKVSHLITSTSEIKNK